jgi:hypothetical protein
MVEAIEKKLKRTDNGAFKIDSPKDHFIKLSSLHPNNSLFGQNPIFRCKTFAHIFKAPKYSHNLAVSSPK